MTRDLAAGRAAFARREWRTAFERLSAADAAAPLEIEPLEERDLNPRPPEPHVTR
jgi:hypothetical protein